MDGTELMSAIADGNYTPEIVGELTEKDKTSNQIKLFLLAQAKRELQRVTKYMKFLDKIEESYKTKVEQLIDEDKLELKDFSNIISVVNGCLARSNEIIKSVLKDDSLNNLVIIDNSTNINNSVIGEDRTGLGLTDPDSRNRVEMAIENILSKINNFNPESDNIVVDYEVSEDE